MQNELCRDQDRILFTFASPDDPFFGGVSTRSPGEWVESHHLWSRTWCHLILSCWAVFHKNRPPWIFGLSYWKHQSSRKGTRNPKSTCSRTFPTAEWANHRRKDKPDWLFPASTTLAQTMTQKTKTRKKARWTCNFVRHTTTGHKEIQEWMRPAL